MVGKMEAGTWGSRSHCDTVRKQRERWRNVHAQPAFSILFSAELLPMRWHCPHSEWGFSINGVKKLPHRSPKSFICNFSRVVCVCVQMLSPVQMCGDQTVMVRCVPILLLHLSFWGRVSHCSGNLLFQIEKLASQPLGCTCLCTPVLDYRCFLPCPSFYSGAGDLNLGPHTASTSPTERPPSPWEIQILSSWQYEPSQWLTLTLATLTGAWSYRIAENQTNASLRLEWPYPCILVCLTHRLHLLP